MKDGEMRQANAKEAALTQRYYPAFLDLRGRRCVVVGGGAVGERKTAQLLAAGAVVTVVSPAVTPAVRAWAAEGSVEWRERPYAPGDLTGAFAAIAGTDDTQANIAVREAAAREGVLLNVVDDAPSCDFIAPAVVERGAVTIAVSTGGASPALARKLREALERWPALAWADAAETLAQARADLRVDGANPPPDAWQEAMSDEMLSLVQAGKPDEAKALLLEALRAAAQDAGG